MSAYYSNQQPPSPGSPSPPNGSASSMAAAAAAAFHWNPFSEFSPYYLQNHNNINSRYPHHLQGYHPHHSHHLNNYSNQHTHQGPFPTPHGQPLFGAALSSSQQPSVSPTSFPSDVKPDPSLDERNHNYVRGSRETFSGTNGVLSNSSTDVKTSTNTASSATTTPQLASNAYLPQQQQQQQQHLLPTHHQVTNNNTTLGHLLSCSETNNPSNVRDFGLSAEVSPTSLQQQQQQQNPLAGHLQHPASSPNFNCLSPSSLAMAGSDQAAAMAAMSASQGGYYDMYGSGGGGGSFGAKGSSFYPWMKNYSGKMEPSEKCFAIIMVICLFLTTLSFLKRHF